MAASPKSTGQQAARLEKDGRVQSQLAATLAGMDATMDKTFAKHFDKDGNPSELLLHAKQDRLENWHLLQELAGLR